MPRETAPTSWATRCFISPAALLVKVTARTAYGDTPGSRIRWAMRWVSTRVLPEPAPARISSGPSVAATASRWEGFRSAKRGESSKGHRVYGSPSGESPGCDSP